MYDFEVDNEYGKKGEELIWLALLKADKTKDVIDVRSDKYFQQLDIDFLQVTYKGFVNKIEVKTDRMAHETGNIAWETKSFGKEGCLARSQADYVYYYVEHTHKTYALLMKPIKEIIGSQEFNNQFKEISMGDKGKGYLLPINWLLKNGLAQEVNI